MSSAKYKIFVINMAGSMERWAAISARLDGLALPYERIEGTDASKIPEEKLPQYYSFEKNKKEYPRPLTAGEIGCYISHIKCWREISSRRLAFGVVLEDDIILSDNFPLALNFLQEHFFEWEFVRLQAETKDRILYAEKRFGSFALREFLRTSGSMWGYAVNFDAAQKLCAACVPFGITVDTNMHLYYRHGIDVLSLAPPVVFSSGADSEINKKQNRKTARNFYPFARQAFQLKSYAGKLNYLIKRDGILAASKKMLQARIIKRCPLTGAK